MAGKRTWARTRSGFTLIELLVVLVIMGLFVGLVSAIVQPDERGLLRVEAERLAQLLELAAEESRLTGNTHAWVSDGPGYAFWRKSSDNEWFELRDHDLLRARSLPQGMRISDLTIENQPARAGLRLEFPAYASSVSFAIKLSLGAEHYQVTASPIGELQVSPGEGVASGALAQH